MAHNPSALRSPKEIAEEANRIYDKISDKIKLEHKGQFMVVEVKTGKYFIHEAAGGAFHEARKAVPHGVCHLIRIGSPTAFKVSQTASHDRVWAW